MDAFGSSQAKVFGDDDWEGRLRNTVQMKGKVMVSLEDTVSVEASMMMTSVERKAISTKKSRFRTRPKIFV